MSTAYGYIHPAEPLAVDPRVRRAERFVEKPDDGSARSSSQALCGTLAISASAVTSCWRSWPVRAGLRRGDEQSCGARREGSEFRGPDREFFAKAPTRRSTMS
jgi:hypothetical protein